MFSPNHYLVYRGQNLFSCRCTMVSSEMSYIAICPCSKDPDFIFFLIRLVYFIPTTMSSVAGNHLMDLFYILKENLLLKISYLTYWSWQGASRIFCIYQVVHCLKGDSTEYTCTYYKALNQILLAQKYQGSSTNRFYGLEAYDTH